MRRTPGTSTIREMQRQTSLRSGKALDAANNPAPSQASSSTGATDPTTYVWEPYGRYGISDYPYVYSE